MTTLLLHFTLFLHQPSLALPGNDVGAVQANCAAPCHTVLFYFEVTILDAGARGTIGVGFADAGFKLSRQPGWEANSWGYHGDDGTYTAVF